MEIIFKLIIIMFALYLFLKVSMWWRGEIDDNEYREKVLYPYFKYHMSRDEQDLFMKEEKRQFIIQASKMFSLSLLGIILIFGSGKFSRTIVASTIGVEKEDILVYVEDLGKYNVGDEIKLLKTQFMKNVSSAAGKGRLGYSAKYSLNTLLRNQNEIILIKNVDNKYTILSNKQKLDVLLTDDINYKNSSIVLE